ncbi:MAG TPA: ABC transporter permease subunit [Dehalococcoidia bacterium]|nr:ABC transporter permease subunit [Dehalococcoidia bacterium]
MLGAELLKIYRRWMPYTLFLIMVAGAALHIWLFGYTSWEQSSDVSESQEALHSFAIPWSIPALLNSGQFWGAILVGILTASVVGTEYSWGTVRQALVRGQTRSQYLTTKLIGIALISAISLLLALAIGIGFSVLATNVADQKLTLDVPDGPSIPEIGMMVLRAGYGILPYGLLAFSLTVVGRSTSLGVAGVLLYGFAESIILAVMAEAGGRFSDARVFLLGHSVNGLLRANRIGDVESFGLAPRDLNRSDFIDPIPAAIIIGLYCVGLFAVTFFVFQRRDVQA